MISFNHLRCQFFCKMPLVKWVWGWKKESNFMWSTYLRVILRKTYFFYNIVYSVAAPVKCADINFNIYAWRHMTYLWPDWKWKSHLAKSVHWVFSFATWPTFRIIFDWRILIPFFCFVFHSICKSKSQNLLISCFWHKKKRKYRDFNSKNFFVVFLYTIYWKLKYY